MLLVAVATGATRIDSATGQQQGQESRPKIAHNVPHCGKTKSYIVQRRSATWGWQDKLAIARSPTAYQEREATCQQNEYLQWIASLWANRADRNYRQYVSLQDPATAIRWVFGPYADQAIAVSRCESHLTTTAQNGQYLGMFQMGTYARELYGHGPTPLEQAIAAHRYFVASGKDWSPWSCKPW